MKKMWIGFISLGVFWGCTDLYDQPLPDYESELIIEAYVNQANPFLNYALLTKSLPYFAEEFEVKGVIGAEITLFKGSKQGTVFSWEDEGLKYEAFEDIPGLYLPPVTSFFVGEEGLYYKLVVKYEGVTSTSITQIPELVPMDTIWVDKVFNSVTDTFDAFLKFQFTDPQQFGNNYLVADYRNSPNDWPLLWGAADRIVVTDDALFNGQQFTYTQIFPDEFGDTVNMYLISIDNETLEYWESYDASRNNGGPFSQPVNVNSTFDNARGTFQGMAIDNKRIIIK